MSTFDKNRIIEDQLVESHETTILCGAIYVRGYERSYKVKTNRLLQVFFLLLNFQPSVLSMWKISW